MGKKLEEKNKFLLEILFSLYNNINIIIIDIIS